MRGPLGYFVLVLSLSFPLQLTHTHTRTHFLVRPSLISLTHRLQFSVYPDSPSFIFCPPSSLHLLLHISTSGNPLTAVMTSFSGLRGVSLLASLNGSLWWPRYRSQSPQSSASEAVFNVTFSLTRPQVVAWTRARLHHTLDFCHLCALIRLSHSVSSWVGLIWGFSSSSCVFVRRLTSLFFPQWVYFP